MPTIPPMLADEPTVGRPMPIDMPDPGRLQYGDAPRCCRPCDGVRCAVVSDVNATGRQVLPMWISSELPAIRWFRPHTILLLSLV